MRRHRIRSSAQLGHSKMITTERKGRAVRLRRDADPCVGLISMNTLDVLPVGALAEFEHPGSPIRVLLIDDHEVVRTGTRQVLETSTSILVVGEAADGDAGLAMIDSLDPDLVLIDIRLPGRNGIDVARQLALTRPRIRVVILSAHDTDEFVRAAFEIGVAGYLLKAMPART